MGNQCCGAQVEQGTLDFEVYKFQDLLSRYPQLTKYQYDFKDNQAKNQDFNLKGKIDNIKNVANCLRSPVYGGAVLGPKNPLKELIRKQKPLKRANGGYFMLQNVQLKKDEPVFQDIWILIDSVKDKEHSLKLQSLHDLGQLNITFWNKDMLYPYTNKFLLLDDIKDSLTGFARIIEFRCFNAGMDGKADPSLDGSVRHNWILSITEGQILKGQPHEYNRIMNAFNGHCQIGYYQYGQPYGKWTEFQANGFHSKDEGIYRGEKLIRKKKIIDWQKNDSPDLEEKNKTTPDGLLKEKYDRQLENPQKVPRYTTPLDQEVKDQDRREERRRGSRNTN